ncbi:hypothetical protein BH10BAC2_BH10BAC2_21820 [soil metagenome]
MDSSVYIAIIIVIAIAMIIWLLTVINNKHKKRVEQEQLSLFSNIAKEFQLKIYKTEQMKDRMLGWDSEISNLLFVDFKSTPLDINHVQIMELSSCKLLTQVANGSEDVTSGSTDTTSISLELHYKNNSFPKQLLTFYAYGRDSLFDLVPLKQKAEHWRDIFNVSKK